MKISLLSIIFIVAFIVFLATAIPLLADILSMYKDEPVSYTHLGTGIGISISANKIKGIRAALCQDYYTAKYTRLHNDANVLCMGGRVIRCV